MNDALAAFRARNPPRTFAVEQRMNISLRPTSLILASVLFAACGPAAVASSASASPSATVLRSGVYVNQPAPLIWQLVTIADGRIANGAGAVFEWSCAGESWTIGRFPASIDGAYLRFGDERFALKEGAPDAPWRLGADPRALPRPICSGATPATKTVLSSDAARELIKGRVTAIAPVLVPTWLPDRVSASVDARADSFTVTYVASTARVTLATELANPRPVEPGGMQRHQSFRRDANAFYQALDASATTSRTLLWNEYTTTTGTATTSIAYMLAADGLTEADFWKVAESLR